MREGYLHKVTNPRVAEELTKDSFSRVKEGWKESVRWLQTPSRLHNASPFQRAIPELFFILSRAAPHARTRMREDLGEIQP